MSHSLLAPQVIAKYIVLPDDYTVDFQLRNEDELTFATATFPLQGRPAAVAAGVDDDD